MSRLQSTRRRLSLLTSSSLTVAGIMAAAASLAPVSSAMAATNPCGTNPNTNGAAPDAIVCPTATYSTGIQHTSNGDLSVTVTPTTNFGNGGVVTTAGQLEDDLTVRMQGTSASIFANVATTAPVVLDAESEQGDILVDIAVVRATATTAQLNANSATTTHFVRAISNDGGDVTVTRSAGSLQLQATGVIGVAGIEARSYGGGNVVIQSSGTGSLAGAGGEYGILASVDGAGVLTVNTTGGSNATGTRGIAGIQATSTGTGAVNVNASGSGRLYGIRAGTTGSGAVTIVGNGVANASGGLAGIHASAGSGMLTITGNGSGGAGTGVIIDADGDVVFTGVASGAVYGIELLGIAAGTTSTLNISSVSGGLAAIRAQGSGTLDVSVTDLLSGGLDFTGLSSSPTIDLPVNAQWRVGATTSVLSDAGVVINNASQGSATRYGGIAIGTRGSLTAVDPDTVITFTGANDRVNNSGLLVINADPDSANATGSNRGAFEAEVRLAGLEVFEHSGTILLGGYADQTRYGTGTDRAPDDILSMPGTTFLGQDGVIVFDVNLLGQGQTACDAVLRDADGDLPAGDCVALIGGETQGTTRLQIVDIFGGDRGAYNPEGTVLVDVGGGTSAAGHFVIDPASENYSSAQGGIIDKGAFFYGLAYDADTQQHKLVGLPGGNALQLPLLTQAATALWRTSTGTWLERQADLRGDIDEGVGGGVWLRASTEIADRDVMQTVEGGGGAFTFDNTHEQTSYAVTGGTDLMNGFGTNSAWALGVMAGYAHADIKYENSPNTGRLDGWTGGLYGSFVSGGLFVDAAVNANKLTMDNDVPALNLFPAGTILSTALLSVGGQVEAGWRLPLMETLFIEPLTGISYVRTKYDNMGIPSDDPSRAGIDLEFDDPVSLRAGVGGRLGLDHDYGGLRAQFSMLGRVWNEFEGESRVTLGNVGADAVVMDEFSGRFTEFGFGASLYGLGEAVSGFVNFGGKFGDDYTSQNLSAGVRVNW